MSGRDETTHHPPSCQHASWERELLDHLHPEFVLLGVGNRTRGDDGAGPVVAERLIERGLPGVFDCGGVPENYITRVAQLKPRDVVVVDAVHFGGRPGGIGLFGGEHVGVQSGSTHSAGLSPVLDFLRAGCDATCWVLAVEPAQVSCGEGLSETVQEAVDAIASSNVWFELSTRRDSAD